MTMRGDWEVWVRRCMAVEGAVWKRGWRRCVRGLFMAVLGGARRGCDGGVIPCVVGGVGGGSWLA